jgi:hypothetical protein
MKNLAIIWKSGGSEGNYLGNVHSESECFFIEVKCRLKEAYNSSFYLSNRELPFAMIIPMLASFYMAYKSWLLQDFEAL